MSVRIWCIHVMWYGCLCLHKHDVTITLVFFIQIECSEGRVLPNEREFLVEPHLGLAYAVKGVTPVMPGGSFPDVSSQGWLTFGKKPFDWLSDNQWKQLLVSGICTR